MQTILQLPWVAHLFSRPCLVALQENRNQISSWAGPEKKPSGAEANGWLSFLALKELRSYRNGCGSKFKSWGYAVLVFGSTYQGAISVPLFKPQPNGVLQGTDHATVPDRPTVFLGQSGSQPQFPVEAILGGEASIHG